MIHPNRYFTSCGLREFSRFSFTVNRRTVQYLYIRVVFFCRFPAGIHGWRVCTAIHIRHGDTHRALQLLGARVFFDSARRDWLLLFICHVIHLTWNRASRYVYDKGCKVWKVCVYVCIYASFLIWNNWFLRAMSTWKSLPRRCKRKRRTNVHAYKTRYSIYNAILHYLIFLRRFAVWRLRKPSIKAHFRRRIQRRMRKPTRAEQRNGLSGSYVYICENIHFKTDVIATIRTPARIARCVATTSLSLSLISPIPKRKKINQDIVQFQMQDTAR